MNREGSQKPVVDGVPEASKPLGRGTPTEEFSNGTVDQQERCPVESVGISDLVDEELLQATEEPETQK